jgi:GT2 family glycosyltransferase
MNQPVAVIVLCMEERSGWIHPSLMMRVVECVSDASRARRQVAIGLKCGISPVEKARNQIVQEFLASPCSWLIQIDNDTVPPARFLQLVSAAETESKLIVGIPTPLVTLGGLSWNVGMRRDEIRCDLLKTLPKGWNTCDYTGAGFLAIHRQVLEAIRSDWFTSMSTHSEDFAFCKRARDAGFQIWFNGDFQCDHAHTISLLKLLSS